MTFPTKADIEFFKEAKRIQELWEPRVGDLVYLRSLGLIAPVIGLDVGPEPDTLTLALRHDEVINYEDGNRTLISLPHQGQLQEMLEEREYCWEVETSSSNEYLGIASPKRPLDALLNPDDVIIKRGPTPSIALGKCLLEVLREHP